MAVDDDTAARAVARRKRTEARTQAAKARAAEEKAINTRVRDLRRGAEAARRFKTEQAAKAWTPPAEGGPLDELLAAPRQGPAFLIDGLFGARHNVVLAGQFKTGKTTLLGTFARALADGKPFLERPVRMPPGARVGWVNGEMDPDDLHDYLRPLAIHDPDRVVVEHLRGGRLPLLDDYVAAWTVGWLRDNAVGVWVVDSWRKLCGWSGVDENVNAEVERLTERIDWIKAESECSAFLTVAHTGRGQEVGAERARGAAALDDWADARWVLTRAEGQRFLSVEGRNVAMPETQLLLDPNTNGLDLGFGNRRTAVNEQAVTEAIAVVGALDGPSTDAVHKALGHKGKDSTGTRNHLREAEARGELHHRDKTSGGKGRYWHLGERPDDVPCVCDWAS